MKTHRNSVSNGSNVKPNSKIYETFQKSIKSNILTSTRSLTGLHQYSYAHKKSTKSWKYYAVLVCVCFAPAWRVNCTTTADDIILYENRGQEHEWRDMKCISPKLKLQKSGNFVLACRDFDLTIRTFNRPAMNKLAKMPDHLNVHKYYGAYKEDEHATPAIVWLNELAGHTTTGTSYEIFDALSGHDLIDWWQMFESQNPTNQRILHVVKKIMYQILIGVKHLHDHGIIHKDIKPDNIWINAGTDFDNPVVQIYDFDYSQCIDDPRGVHSGCTRLYDLHLSLEDQKNFESRKKIDVYSIGMIVYCLLGDFSGYKSLREYLEFTICKNVDEMWTIDQCLASDFIGEIPDIRDRGLITARQPETYFLSVQNNEEEDRKAVENQDIGQNPTKESNSFDITFYCIVC